jgi:hypothetical protein
MTICVWVGYFQYGNVGDDDDGGELALSELLGGLPGPRRTTVTGSLVADDGDFGVETAVLDRKPLMVA